MTEPSEYERDAWQNVQQFKGRPLSRAVRNASEQAATGAARIGDRAAEYLEGRPRAKAALSRGQEVAAKGARVIGSGARKAADAVPEGLADWSGAGFDSVRKMVGRASRVGLSSKSVVKRHQKLGHDVGLLSDLRHLDLEQIDAVSGRGASLYYPIAAAASGAGAGLVISGGALAVPVSGGVAAAPSAVAVAGAMAGDAAVVLGLASRSVGQVSLCYGYDPEVPEEKLFIMAVVNAGTAMSAGAKTAAMADISRLTQALVRGKAWSVLDKSVVSQVFSRFTRVFGARFTKQSLGKVVPAAGIVLGGAFNWATLEGIVDAADVAYRRRFLLEKYPNLSAEEAPDSFRDETPEDNDESISVLDELAKAGGPDLRQTGMV